MTFKQTGDCNVSAKWSQFPANFHSDHRHSVLANVSANHARTRSEHKGIPTAAEQLQNTDVDVSVTCHSASRHCRDTQEQVLSLSQKPDCHLVSEERPSWIVRIIVQSLVHAGLLSEQSPNFCLFMASRAKFGLCATRHKTPTTGEVLLDTSRHGAKIVKHHTSGFTTSSSLEQEHTDLNNMPATTRSSTRLALADISPTNQGQPIQLQPGVTMFTCASCWDEASETVAVTVGSDSLCEECFTNGIKAQFLDAIKDETKYPVKYGAEDLNIHDHERFFSDSFLKNWSTKEKEYKTPMQERLYCSRVIFVIPADHEFGPGSSTAASKQVCGSFLGDKRGCLSDVTSCSGCTGPVCSKCSEPLDGAKVHRCKKSKDDDPFEEMTRGVDYQICPNESCQMKMMLWDGCNSLRCQYCRTQLCFICGKQPAANHFSKGKCPRFGKLGDERAIHDTMGPAQNDFDDIFQRGFRAPFSIPRQDTHSLEERFIDTLVTHLERIHERIFSFSIPRHAAVNPVHDLTHTITEQLQRFRITLLDPERSFRGSRRLQSQDRAITTAVARIGDDGFQLFPGLDLVIASYRQVWADALTEDSMDDAIRHIAELVDR